MAERRATGRPDRFPSRRQLHLGRLLHHRFLARWTARGMLPRACWQYNQIAVIRYDSVRGGAWQSATIRLAASDMDARTAGRNHGSPNGHSHSRDNDESSTGSGQGSAGTAPSNRGVPMGKSGENTALERASSAGGGTSA